MKEVIGEEVGEGREIDDRGEGEEGDKKSALHERVSEEGEVGGSEDSNQ